MAESLGSRYVLQEAIGRGAMGQVFTGSIRSTGEPVAIKVLRPELVSDPEVVTRFVQERNILMSVADPNVVRVIDLVIEGDTLAIVMELVRGSDLRRLLRTRGTLPPSEALRLTGQVLRGVGVVHAAGIIHRDIKPENVLVDTSSGQPLLKLTDFGIARLSYGSSLTKVSGVIGTPEYMAPELVEGDRATPAADVYSAGIVLYEMLCGRTPFAGGHPLAVLRRQADQAPPVIPDVPGELWNLIAWMLAKNPRSRPASAKEACAALAPLERSAAPWPALAPWAGPETGTPGPDAWSRTVTAPGAARVSPPDRAGTMPGATVLRHRDHGDAVPSGGSGGPAPWPAADGGWGPGQLRMSAVPSRRKRQARMAVIAVAAAAVLGLVTTVAMAATHRTSALTPTAGEQTTTATSSMPASPASAPDTGSQAAAPGSTASAGGTSAGGASAGGASAGGGVGSAASGSGTSGSAVSGGGPSGSTVSSGGGKTGTSGSGSTGTGSTGTGSTGTGSTGTGSTGTGTGASSLSTAEQQLANELNPAIFYDCTARPDLETGASVAALNCSYSGTTLTMRPAVESFAAGNAAAWFHQWTSSFKSGTNCVGGSFLGSWYHGSTTEGQMGCALLSGGILRIVWVLGQVGFIAEGPDPTAVDAWWKSNACALLGGC